MKTCRLILLTIRHLDRPDFRQFPIKKADDVGVSHWSTCPLSLRLSRVGIHSCDELTAATEGSRAAELYAAVTDHDGLSASTSTEAAIHLELTQLVVQTRTPLAPDSLVKLNLRLSSDAPALLSTARVTSVTPPSAAGEPAIMRLSLFDSHEYDMRGTLARIPVASLLCFTELERRSGVLTLRREGEEATIYLRNGAIARIDLCPVRDDLEALARAFRVLDWTDGHFALVGDEVEIPDTFGRSTTQLLLEHARMRDESARLDSK